MRVQRSPDGRVRRIEPRPVEVLHDGAWLPGWQDGWMRWPSGDWWASVSYYVTYEWGRGQHVKFLPADQVRLPG